VSRTVASTDPSAAASVPLADWDDCEQEARIREDVSARRLIG
jgi:hypothetical protein